MGAKLGILDELTNILSTLYCSVLVENDGHYFVGANDGMFGMVFDRMPESGVELLPEPLLHVDTKIQFRLSIPHSLF
ncbi:MAG: hypothetical protein LBD59_06555 [Prevotellaceae bacterium]|jgi:hypothetical protein|nr:hypothetical protein [Prevotellaceae bacterium]